MWAGEYNSRGDSDEKLGRTHKPVEEGGFYSEGSGKSLEYFVH